MTSSLVAQINAAWRVVRLQDNAAWRNASWSVERLGEDGEWRGMHAVRTREPLLDFVQHRCGKIDLAASVILSDLPERSDRRPATDPKPRYVRKRKSAPAVPNAPPRRPAPEKTIGLDGKARKRSDIERELMQAVINTGGTLIT